LFVRTLHQGYLVDLTRLPSGCEVASAALPFEFPPTLERKLRKPQSPRDERTRHSQMTARVQMQPNKMKRGKMDLLAFAKTLEPRHWLLQTVPGKEELLGLGKGKLFSRPGSRLDARVNLARSFEGVKRLDLAVLAY